MAPPTLPAHGDDKTPIAQATLARYTQTIVDAIDAQPGPVILVGHSMAGAIVSQAAEAHPDRVRLIVYLAAALLEDGKAVTSVTTNDPESYLAKNIQFQPNATLTLKPEAVRQALYADCSDEDAMWAASRLGAEPLGALATGIHVTAENWGRVTRAYITTKQESGNRPDAAEGDVHARAVPQRRRARHQPLAVPVQAGTVRRDAAWRRARVQSLTHVSRSPRLLTPAQHALPVGATHRSRSGRMLACRPRTRSPGSFEHATRQERRPVWTA